MKDYWVILNFITNVFMTIFSTSRAENTRISDEVLNQNYTLIHSIFHVSRFYEDFW
jgi:hypothetical protein